jgi:hypothetical protein
MRSALIWRIILVIGLLGAEFIGWWEGEAEGFDNLVEI